MQLRTRIEGGGTQALDRWLGTTRSETQILYKESVFKEGPK